MLQNPVINLSVSDYLTSLLFLIHNTTLKVSSYKIFRFLVFFIAGTSFVSIPSISIDRFFDGGIPDKTSHFDEG